MKNILISGGSRGLGLEIAKKQVTIGNHAIVICRTPSQELTELQSQFPSLVTTHFFDLQNYPKLKQNLFTRLIGVETPIHGLVNNAAIAYEDLVTDINHQSLANMFEVNVFAAMELTRNVIRNMLLHQYRGSIVHISSVCVHTGYKGLSMYAASKGAIEAFSKNAAREWGAKGIRSNCVVAGFMETEMTKSLDSTQKESIYKRSALKQPTSQASVAATASYLLSEDSNSITGQNLVVDSGTI